MGKNKNNVNPNSNPYRVGNPNREFIDFNTQRVCPSCGKAININHNFCKYCGVDLSDIKPVGRSDKVIKQLAITAVTDPDQSVRKQALDTLGSFKDDSLLGVLTYVLFNDPDPVCRKEAADELGDIHHRYSLEALAEALKDEDAEVRKEAIEGLKKIKEKNKPSKLDKGKPEERIEDYKEEEKFEVPAETVEEEPAEAVEEELGEPEEFFEENDEEF